MNSLHDGMVFGAQYFRPPFPGKDCWQRDMENMVRLGFNTVKLWAVWNWIEREPGKFYFDDLDELINIAHSVGLLVVINTIPEGAPYWTIQGNEDALYQTASGGKVSYGGPANLPTAGWPGLCLDKPQAAALVERFIRTLAEHVKDHPAMLAIDVWNEPHLEPMFDYRGDMLCYCNHSKARFRKWLQSKYVTLERLNDTWFRTYTTWEQVDPPPRLGTWTDMMDWRLFWMDNLRRLMRLRAAAAKRGAPDLPVQSHVAYSGYVGASGNGGLANELGDEFLLSREVDVFGLTCFPKWLMRKDPLFNHFLNNLIVAEASRGKPFYQVELQGGGGKAGLLGGEVPDAFDIRMWNYLSIAAGGKGVTYWQYAPEPAGIESPGFGLTGFQGENTERSLEAGRCAKELNTPLLGKAKPVKTLNAVYLSRVTSAWFYGAGRQEALYAQAIHGMCKAAYLRGIPFGFVHQDYLDTAWDEGVRTLMLPMPITLSADEIDMLELFIRTGGTIVAEAYPGLYDQTGLLDQSATVLRRLFGLDHVEVQGLPEDVKATAIKDTEPVFTGILYKHIVRPFPTTKTIAYFQDGHPAWTEYSLGKGKGIWFGSFLSLPYAKGEAPENEDVLVSYLYPEGYSAFEYLDVPVGEGFFPALSIVIRLLLSNGQYILIAVNPTGKDVPVTIRLRESGHEHEEVLFHVPSQSAVVELLSRLTER